MAKTAKEQAIQNRLAIMAWITSGLITLYHMITSAGP